MGIIQNCNFCLIHGFLMHSHIYICGKTLCSICSVFWFFFLLVRTSAVSFVSDWFWDLKSSRNKLVWLTSCYNSFTDWITRLLKNPYHQRQIDNVTCILIAKIIVLFLWLLSLSSSLSKSCLEPGKTDRILWFFLYSKFRKPNSLDLCNFWILVPTVQWTKFLIFTQGKMAEICCEIICGLDQTWWTGDMFIPLQFASLYHGQVGLHVVRLPVGSWHGLPRW